MRVIVIGAGPAGLCALRHLKEKPELYEPMAFEKMDCIGGNWVYSDETDLDENGFTMHSNVYKNLRRVHGCNGPSIQWMPQAHYTHLNNVSN